MYVGLLLLLLAPGLWAVVTGLAQSRRGRVVAGVAGISATVLFFSLLGFWAEMLWFESVGYERRFWTMVALKGASTVGCALVAALVVWCLVRPIAARRAMTKGWPELSAMLIGGRIGWSSWDELALFLGRFTTGVEEPILGRDIGFYLFVLPLLDQLFVLLAVAVGIAIVGVAVGTLVSTTARGRGPSARVVCFAPRAIAGVSLAATLLLAAGAGLGIFHLLYSEWGVVAGPGWTDVHVRRPAYAVVLIGTLGIGVWGALRGARARDA